MTPPVHLDSKTSQKANDSYTTVFISEWSKAVIDTIHELFIILDIRTQQRDPETLYTASAYFTSHRMCPTLHPRVHLSTPRDLGIVEQSLLSSDKHTSVLQTTKNLIEGIEQTSLISPPPYDIINPRDLAVQASQQLGHHTLEVYCGVQNSLGHTCGGVNRPSGVAMVNASWASAASGICQYPCTCQASQNMSLPARRPFLLFGSYDTRYLLTLLVDRAAVTHQAKSSLFGCSHRRSSPYSLQIAKHQLEFDQGSNPCRQPRGLDR